MTAIRYRTADVNGLRVFYREAGNLTAPKLLLLHGFPSAGHMFRDLIPHLTDRFHMIASDLPGFGQTDMPAQSEFTYTFDHLANVIDHFTEVVGFDRFGATRGRTCSCKDSRKEALTWGSAPKCPTRLNQERLGQCSHAR
jgi:alpha-beta hydrolase superfamily lysophospholipase